ncbi:MAG: branched-chain amino acid ABC transporter permease [Acidimicrobiia bacterium]
MRISSRLRSALLLVALAAAWPAIGNVGADAIGGDEDEPATTTTVPVGAQGFTGTLLEAGEGVEDVEIVVTTLEGEEVGSARTTADGMWTVTVPVPGRYRVTLDAGTLPEDVELRDPERDTLELDVFVGNLTRALFSLGDEEGAGGPNVFERLAQSATNGLKFGLIISMASIGLSLIFGTTGLINFAHGELVTFGAIVAWFLNARGPHLQLIVAGILATIIAGLVGGALERGVWRPLRVRQVGLFQLFVITIGLSLVIRHMLLIWFGGRRRGYLDYTIQQQWELGPISLTPRDFTIMILSVIILVAVATMLLRTRLGKAMRAVADNVDLSEASGIDVQRVILVVWVMGTALAAIGGIFLGTIEAVDWEMGTRLLLLMFAAVILGGLGTAYGAMVGGILVGLVTEISTIWVSPALKLVFALGALVLALIIRPQGILGRQERVG